MWHEQADSSPPRPDGAGIVGGRTRRGPDTRAHPISEDEAHVGRTLVAGVGNVFYGDDGFGVAVAQRLTEETLPTGVDVQDFGIRGVHLAFRLLDGYDLLVLIDTVDRDDRPGTLYVIEPDLQESSESVADAHGMVPDAVLALVPKLGGTLGRVVVVGCCPLTLTERIGLSPEVAKSIEPAARLVLNVIASHPSEQEVT